MSFIMNGTLIWKIISLKVRVEISILIFSILMNTLVEIFFIDNNLK